MKIIYQETLKYSNFSPKFCLNLNDIIDSEHLESLNLNLWSFEDDIKKTSCAIYYCYQCQLEINNDLINYICDNCNKIFCINCYNIHSKEINHQNKSIFNNINLLCSIHNLKKYYFCKYCKKNICNECTNINHIGHEIISFPLLMDKNEKEKIELEIYGFNLKINNLKNFVSYYCFDEIKNEDFFLKLLIEINEKFLKNFNYSILNYYNYKNFYYFYYFIKYFNKPKIKSKLCLFKENKNINKIIYNELNIKKLENLYLFKDICSDENIKMFNDNYTELIYFNNNIFIKIDKLYASLYQIIKIYEYKNNSIEYLNTINLGYPINLIKISYFKKNQIIVYSTKNIFIFQYNNYNSTFYFLQKIRFGSKSTIKFFDVIDNKNENILISTNYGVKLWSKNKLINTNMVKFEKMYNLTDLIFMGKAYKNINSINIPYIFFYETNNYDLIKDIEDKNYEYVGVIKNKLLVLQTNKEFHLIDLKFLEIVSIIECGNYVSKINKIINNVYLIGLYEFNEEQNNNLRIIKRKYNEKYNIFDKNEIIEKKLNIIKKDIKIIDTDKDYFLLIQENNIIFIQL